MERRFLIVYGALAIVTIFVLGGLVAIDDAIKRSLPNGRPRPVDELADPHHLADTDPEWAGGDAKVRAKGAG